MASEIIFQWLYTFDSFWFTIWSIKLTFARKFEFEFGFEFSSLYWLKRFELIIIKNFEFLRWSSKKSQRVRFTRIWHRKAISCQSSAVPFAIYLTCSKSKMDSNIVQWKRKSIMALLVKIRQKGFCCLSIFKKNLKEEEIPEP